MPRLNVDYSKTVIYKIQHNDDETLLYVGSTTNFNKRKSQHKNACKNESDKNHNLKVYRMIRENGGWDCFSMTKIEDYPCENGRDAEAREDKLMRELKANMNAHRAFIEDPIAENRVYNLRWRQNNREEEKARHKHYRETHQEQVREYNRNRMNVSSYCEACDCQFLTANLNRHRLTNKHNNNIVRLMEEGAAARDEQ
tara:strand:+ start:334 stop:927 length:594 start_codon:yes stop_codon:yes gene_type:complete